MTKSPEQAATPQVELDSVKCSMANLSGALRAFSQRRPNLILVDCGEPTNASVRMIEKLRLLSEVPMMALVADEQSGLDALRWGADVLLPRPLSWDELELRTASLLRRAEDGAEEILSTNLVTVDRIRHAVLVRGELFLTPTEFRMLTAFAEHPEVVLTHERLLESAWKDAFRGRDEVKLYVSYLRRRFAPLGVNPIETVRGVGYMYRPHSLVADSTN